MLLSASAKEHQGPQFCFYMLMPVLPELTQHIPFYNVNIMDKTNKSYIDLILTLQKLVIGESGYNESPKEENAINQELCIVSNLIFLAC